MNVPRREVSKALFSLIQSVTWNGGDTWKFSEPTARHWAKVAAMQQPYAGLYVPAQDAEEPQAFGITKWTLYYSLLIYARRDAFPPAEGDAFGYFLDDLIDAVELAFQGPRPGESQMLYYFTDPSKVLVQEARIVGRIDRDEGLLDQQGKIEIPIKVITGF